MKDEETFTVDWPYLKEQAREAWRIYFAPLVWAWRNWRIALLVVAVLIVAVALTGCATPVRYTTVYCLTRAQFDALKATQPKKVRDQLTGDAAKDVGILAGSAIRLRAYSDGLLEILGGCVDPQKQ